MYLTRESEIAIGILTNCIHEAEEAHTTRKLAHRLGVTKDHAARVVAILVRNGLLQSRRGRTGGVVLNVDPESLSVGMILRATQPVIVRRPRTRNTNPSGTAGIFHMLAEATSEYFIELADTYKIADVTPTKIDGSKCRSRRLAPPVPSAGETDAVRRLNATI
ncbi:Rrf2 family transcriptional regulator [Agrobacterium sp. SOY23]|uniref:Rrf2 family transcriptional regulator n=1 Tax=Agrobacterium sp. SOY23 TaxID=3014555 RepID=UPI001B0B6969|nr:Rrf2 family transcriptional regulator [Agrobacterium sp. SOY23]MBO9653745.1 Rrf2 family transcriptional regulator [Agrobacterium tumefaciens]MCZ4431421.1 Rrf2 family transcriptional regulator [Agrobacterium sp. SOY23]